MARSGSREVALRHLHASLSDQLLILIVFMNGESKIRFPEISTVRNTLKCSGNREIRTCEFGCQF